MFGVLALKAFSAGKSMDVDPFDSFFVSMDSDLLALAVPSGISTTFVCTDAVAYSGGDDSGDDTADEVGSVLDRVSDTFCSRISVSDRVSSLAIGTE